MANATASLADLNTKSVDLCVMVFAGGYGLARH
jgi:hypothetical protein